MTTKSRNITSLLALAVCGLLVGMTAPAQAATYIGPVPYKSFSNINCGPTSPFSSVSFTDYFYLEDFESGSSTITTPGVTSTPMFNLGPQSHADSVDWDDGVCDGFGTAGHSWWSGFPNGATSVTFTFNAAALGGNLPTHAGIVFTDTLTATNTDGVSFEAYDATGTLIPGAPPSMTLGDGTTTGETPEDRFFGVHNCSGISSIKVIMSSSNNFEVDHLQYGYAPCPTVPTVSEWGLGALALLLLSGVAIKFGRRRAAV